MATSKRVSKEQERKRRLILEAAKRLFAKEGFDNVSMRRIAAEADYSPAAIYRYFRSKREILSHLRNQGFAEFSSNRAYLEESLSPEELLREAGRSYIRFAMNNPDDFHLMFCTSCREVDLEGELAGASLESYRRFRSMVGRVVESGYFGDADEEAVAFGLWAGVQGLASLITSGRAQIFSESDVDDLMERVLRFLRRPAGTGDRSQGKR
ncbi:TetR/AcrR family transcriptional regulator [Salidesulfovibrio onnuriiensis]|uniref:TetR/AcrR family transcriptional regulator n=1 Tax=Salidesulfovibrio onnuriiensis TaxID=2583823 RepID=UPI0011C95989|nr:TetR/AcrR family transcriptional regulator [Salidesulfovibrio onnuriiensis]